MSGERNATSDHAAQRSPVTKSDFDASLVPDFRQTMIPTYAAIRQIERRVAEMYEEQHAQRARVFHDRNCPLCGTESARANAWFSVQGLDIVECPNCTLVYSRNVLREELDRSRYDSQMAADIHKTLRGNVAYKRLEDCKADYVLQRLEQTLGRTGSVFDVGANLGAFMKRGQLRGWHVTGIEINATLAAEARAQGLEIAVGKFPEDAPAGRYDVLNMLDVLEHVEDPIAFLEKCTEYLAPGGLISIQVPNLNSPLLRLEGAANSNFSLGHWSYFTPKTLLEAAQAAGLSSLFVETYITELDRLKQHDQMSVRRVLSENSGRIVNFDDELTPELLHELLAGYKIFGLFRAENS